jgi:hypothetical protein
VVKGGVIINGPRVKKLICVKVFLITITSKWLGVCPFSYPVGSREVFPWGKAPSAGS